MGEKRGARKHLQSLREKENIIQKANQGPILMKAVVDVFVFAVL